MCYITMKMNISSLAGMAELADAAGSKSAEVHPSWGFDSPSRHQLCNLLKAPFAVPSLHGTTFLQDYPQLNEADSGLYRQTNWMRRLLFRYPGEIPTDKKLCHCRMMGVFHGHSAGLES